MDMTEQQRLLPSMSMLQAFSAAARHESFTEAAAELAATGLSDLTDPEPALRTMARDRLTALLTAPALVEAAPAVRVAAGQALAGLGDPRNFDELVSIPAGPFLMGDDTDKRAKPQHRFILSAFKIGKYPVFPGFHSMPLQVVTINKDIWNELPESIQTMMETAV